MIYEYSAKGIASMCVDDFSYALALWVYRKEINWLKLWMVGTSSTCRPGLRNREALIGADLAKLLHHT